MNVAAKTSLHPNSLLSQTFMIRDDRCLLREKTEHDPFKRQLRISIENQRTALYFPQNYESDQHCLLLKPLLAGKKHLAAVVSNHPEPLHSSIIQALELQFGLTKREAQIASMLVTGRTASMIGQRLNLRINTVRTHIKHIYLKINVKNQLELMARFLPFSFLG